MTLGTQAKHLNHYTPANWFLSKTTYTDNSNLFQLSKVFQLQCFTLFQLWKINWKIRNKITSAQLQHNHGKLLDLYWRYLNPKSKNIQTGASCAKLVVGLCYILIILQGCGNTVMLCFSPGKLSEKSYLSVRNPTCPVLFNIRYLETQLWVSVWTFYTKYCLLISDRAVCTSMK
jgi:hypothetical protein